MGRLVGGVAHQLEVGTGGWSSFGTGATKTRGFSPLDLHPSFSFDRPCSSAPHPAPAAAPKSVLGGKIPSGLGGTKARDSKACYPAGAYYIVKNQLKPGG